MKIPDNNEVIRFIKTFGLISVIIIFCLIIAWRTTLSFINKINESTSTQCKIMDLENRGVASLYKGKSFFTEGFTYGEYDFIGDVIYLTLREKK